MYAKITGVGSYLPAQAVSNDDLVARGVDTSDEWIATRTGIRNRHLAEPGQTSSDLGFEAARRALEMAGVDAAELDLIIVATSTPDFIFPSTACLLQSKLGNKGATCFDVQAVCAGFVYALSIAEKFVRSGSHKKALVVGAEVFSRILDWNDRGTCVLFGDGAGATAEFQPRSVTASDHAGFGPNDRATGKTQVDLSQSRHDRLHRCEAGSDHAQPPTRTTGGDAVLRIRFSLFRFRAALRAAATAADEAHAFRPRQQVGASAQALSLPRYQRA